MAQIVTHNGKTYATKGNLTSADVKRLTGYNSNKSRWQQTVGAGKPFVADDVEFAALQRYLSPVAETTGRWQDDPATQAQLNYLARLRVHVEGNLTKGQASALIEAAKRDDAAVQYEDGPGSTEVY